MLILIGILTQVMVLNFDARSFSLSDGIDFGKSQFLVKANKVTNGLHDTTLTAKKEKICIL